MAPPQRLTLADVRWHGPQLTMRFELGAHPFDTTVWYGDVDLDALERRLGTEAMECLVLHLAAFEINKLCSLRPEEIHFGRFGRFVSPRFVETWTRVLVKVWAQWRYEHDLPHWRGPRVVQEATGKSVPAALPAQREGESLLFFGGGKDSLVAASLLDGAGVPWASHSYAHSAYGPPEPQLRYAGALLDTLGPRRRHAQWIADSAFAAPLTRLLPERGAKSFTAAETPSSVFEALPLALTHGYARVVLAHEHSANRGNLIWEATGEDVNHQWGKSWEAERLLASYIEEELVPGFRWFSVLQPLSDVLIFELLRDTGEAVLGTHSCNVQKPWCYRCAKCAYVALGYAAHLQDGIYERVFREDVLDLPENEGWFRGLMGLGEHTPFECVGEVGETRLALALCAARGRRSRAVRIFQEEVGAVNVEEVLARYGVVHEPHGIPPEMAGAILPRMREAARTARERIVGLLG